MCFRPPSIARRTWAVTHIPSELHGLVIRHHDSALAAECPMKGSDAPRQMIMQMRTYRRLIALAVLGIPTIAAAQDHDSDAADFGIERDAFLAAHAKSLFGFEGTVASSTASVDAATADADPTSLATVAKGLKIKVESAAANLGANTDQMALWPNDIHPTHLIVINEEGTTAPGVQRIRLSDGAVETILTGTTSGDPLRRTPWGTILAGEEAGATGQMIEILNPLETTGGLYDRVTGIARLAPRSLRRVEPMGGAAPGGPAFIR
jgi:hypothetical protein